MRLKRKFELSFLLILGIFSWWLMNKSFGYNPTTNEFRIARNEVGDFGLHLSLARSFSWGQNSPVQSPFFPGPPLVYHYGFDYIVGILERLGMRIDFAINGLSIVAFALLLFMVYKISSELFYSRATGMITVLLFIMPSNLGFVDFFRTHWVSGNIFKDIWRLPDYIHTGPYDGSLISTFFTLNVFLNQRHFVLALSLSLVIIHAVIHALVRKRALSWKKCILLGIGTGLLAWVHSLVFIGTLAVIGCLCVLTRHTKKWLIPFLLSAMALSFGRIGLMIFQRTHAVTGDFWYFGYLSQQPFSMGNFVYFWVLNLGIFVCILPFGLIKATSVQKKIFLSFLSLFVIANIVQLGFRIEHNQALVRMFFVVPDAFVAFVLVQLWQKSNVERILAVCLFFVLTLSGIFDLMAIKNDYQLMVPDAPKNRFMQWMKDSTSPNTIFLSRQNLYDPVTLAGRKNYFGSTYYSEVMGYSYMSRRVLVKEFFEAHDLTAIERMRDAGISYLVIDRHPPADFSYSTDVKFLRAQLPVAYSDSDVTVFQL